MKKELFGGTALAGMAALAAGAAFAAEAPTWKLTGNANFQFYWVDQDATGVVEDISFNTWTTLGPSGTGRAIEIDEMDLFGAGTADAQDHGWYFGVDEAELQLNVSGTADNGLNYGFKIEINANTTDGTLADEVRLQLSGGWGTLQMGDEDGAEDIMNYGGESLMGATGGFDGDQDDYLYRAGEVTKLSNWYVVDSAYVSGLEFHTKNSHPMNVAAPSYPTIAGDTSDKTKISYFSPRFSGFQVGASLTPTPNNGDDFKEDGAWENHIGFGANYDNSFGDLRIRASIVYSHASNAEQNPDSQPDPGMDAYTDISAFSVGGIVGWGPFSLGANYTDNGDSGQPMTWGLDNDTWVVAPIETAYWNVAAGFETGPMYFSVGYFSSWAETTAPLVALEDSTYEHIALTADYTVAPGLGVYAEINLISEELIGGQAFNFDFAGDGRSLTNDTTSLVIGANISF